ncbi:MAG: J domain-containing protein [Cyanobacteria bacterium P01_H01_bin.15]
MELSDCYRLFGLTQEASSEDIKKVYRQLVRRYHPDLHPQNRQAQVQFLRIAEAYKHLLGAAANASLESKSVTYPQQAQRFVKVTDEQLSAHGPEIKGELARLKAQIYQQLTTLLKTERYPRAVTLLEALRQKLPDDPEIGQWLAISYQQWGRHCLARGQRAKARCYWRKAIQSDPHNRSLLQEIQANLQVL